MENVENYTKIIVVALLTGLVGLVFYYLKKIIDSSVRHKDAGKYELLTERKKDKAKILSKTIGMATEIDHFIIFHISKQEVDYLSKCKNLSELFRKESRESIDLIGRDIYEEVLLLTDKSIAISKYNSAELINDWKVHHASFIKKIELKIENLHK